MTNESVRFAQPQFLWFLPLVVLLLLFWVLRLTQRRREIRRLRNARISPLTEGYRLAGSLAFWGWLVLASAALALALAMPQSLQSVSDAAPVDLVVIQDGSASLRATDVYPSRWQRSLRFLRTLAESLPWKGDRMGLAVFANHALPQVRLVRDPNTVFFFIDHLKTESPFALEDNTSWDTNAYEGIRWGLKLIAKDEEHYGKNANPKALILLSDGDRFSGMTEAVIAEARNRRIPIHVIGVGTTSGAPIPLPKTLQKVDMTSDYWKYRAQLELEKKREGIPLERIHSSIDRDSLQRIAALGGGSYFELDADPDSVIAARIIREVRRLGSTSGGLKTFCDLYWPFLLLAAIFFALGILSYR